MDKIILGFLTSFFVVLLSTPALIKLAKLKHIVDEQLEDRKLHPRSIPTIGGIIIFAGTLLAYTLWFPFEDNSIIEYAQLVVAITEFKYLITCLLILFFIGIKDDIIGTSPVKKLLGHIVVAFILVLMGEIQITSLHGLFGVYEIPYWAAISISVFVYIVIVNSFNLIDGVDGLAAGIGFISAVSFGLWFFFADNISLSMIAFVLAGSLLGFLIFNFAPAKIFMGDSGSLTLGVIMSVLAIRAVETNPESIPDAFSHVSTPVFAMAILAYPLVDTLRVFLHRAVRGVSPFQADKNHIHHKLLRVGLNHSQTVLVLYVFNMLCILTAIYLPIEEPTLKLFVVGGGAFAVAQLAFLIRNKTDVL